MWYFVCIIIGFFIGFCTCGLSVSNHEDKEIQKWKNLAQIYKDKINDIQAKYIKIE